MARHGEGSEGRPGRRGQQQGCVHAGRAGHAPAPHHSEATATSVKPLVHRTARTPTHWVRPCASLSSSSLPASAKLMAAPQGVA